MLESNVELIQHVPLFRGLSLVQLTAIVRIAQKVFFEPGENLITKNESGDASYLVMTGMVVCPRLVDGKEIAEELGPGTLIGELALLIDTVHHLSVIATQRVRALAIRRDAFRTIMEADCGIAEHISRHLVERLRGIASTLRAVDNQLAKIEQLAEAQAEGEAHFEIAQVPGATQRQRQVEWNPPLRRISRQF